MQLGEWVRAERKRHKWTMKYLAERMTATGVTEANEPWVQMVETGKINAARIGSDKLQALAEAFGLTVDAMLQAAEQRPVTAAEALRALEQGRRGDPELAEIRALLDQLPDERRAEILGLLRLVVQGQLYQQERPRPARREAAGELDQNPKLHRPHLSAPGLGEPQTTG